MIQIQMSGRLWLWWVLASAMGAALAEPTSGRLSSAVGNAVREADGLVFGAVYGAVTGALLVRLRRRWSRRRAQSSPLPDPTERFVPWWRTASSAPGTPGSGSPWGRGNDIYADSTAEGPRS